MAKIPIHNRIDRLQRDNVNAAIVSNGPGKDHLFWNVRMMARVEPTIFLALTLSNYVIDWAQEDG